MIDKALDYLGLTEIQDKYLSELSGGQRQKSLYRDDDSSRYRIHSIRWTIKQSRYETFCTDYENLKKTCERNEQDNRNRYTWY